MAKSNQPRDCRNFRIKITLMPEMLAVRPLSPETWPAFAELVEANGGIFGGCWCIGFHFDPKAGKGQLRPYKENKERLVNEGRAQAALVFEGERALGWCQFGPTHELQNIKNRKNYEAGLDQLPDWRLPCFFVGKGNRKKGVAKRALKGALEMIAELGGGVVEAYPFDTEAQPLSSSFLHAGTLKMFVEQGFDKVRLIGKSQWVVRKTIPAKRS